MRQEQFAKLTFLASVLLWATACCRALHPMIEELCDVGDLSSGVQAGLRKDSDTLAEIAGCPSLDEAPAEQDWARQASDLWPYLQDPDSESSQTAGTAHASGWRNLAGLPWARNLMSVYPRNGNSSTYAYIDPKPSPWKYAQSGGDGTIVLISEVWTSQTVYPPAYTQDGDYWVTPTQGIRGAFTPPDGCPSDVPRTRFAQLLPYTRYYQRSNYNVAGVMSQWYAAYEIEGKLSAQNAVGSAVISGVAGRILPRAGKDVEKVLHRPHQVLSIMILNVSKLGLSQPKLDDRGATVSSQEDLTRGERAQQLGTNLNFTDPRWANLSIKPQRHVHAFGMMYDGSGNLTGCCLSTGVGPPWNSNRCTRNAGTLSFAGKQTDGQAVPGWSADACGMDVVIPQYDVNDVNRSKCMAPTAINSPNYLPAGESITAEWQVGYLGLTAWFKPCPACRAGPCDMDECRSNISRTIQRRMMVRGTAPAPAMLSELSKADRGVYSWYECWSGVFNGVLRGMPQCAGLCTNGAGLESMIPWQSLDPSSSSSSSLSPSSLWPGTTGGRSWLMAWTGPRSDSSTGSASSRGCVSTSDLALSMAQAPGLLASPPSWAGPESMVRADASGGLVAAVFNRWTTSASVNITLDIPILQTRRIGRAALLAELATDIASSVVSSSAACIVTSCVDCPDPDNETVWRVESDAINVTFALSSPTARLVVSVEFVAPCAGSVDLNRGLHSWLVDNSDMNGGLDSSSTTSSSSSSSTSSSRSSSSLSSMPVPFAGPGSDSGWISEHGEAASVSRLASESHYSRPGGSPTAQAVSLVSVLRDENAYHIVGTWLVWASSSANQAESREDDDADDAADGKSREQRVSLAIWCLGGVAGPMYLGVQSDGSLSATDCASLVNEQGSLSVSDVLCWLSIAVIVCMICFQTCGGGRYQMCVEICIGCGGGSPDSPSSASSVEAVCCGCKRQYEQSRDACSESSVSACRSARWIGFVAIAVSSIDMPVSVVSLSMLGVGGALLLQLMSCGLVLRSTEIQMRRRRQKLPHELHRPLLLLESMGDSSMMGGLLGGGSVGSQAGGSETEGRIVTANSTTAPIPPSMMRLSPVGDVRGASRTVQSVRSDGRMMIAGGHRSAAPNLCGWSVGVEEAEAHSGSTCIVRWRLFLGLLGDPYASMTQQRALRKALRTAAIGGDVSILRLIRQSSRQSNRAHDVEHFEPSNFDRPLPEASTSTGAVAASATSPPVFVRPRVQESPQLQDTGGWYAVAKAARHGPVAVDIAAYGEELDASRRDSAAPETAQAVGESKGLEHEQAALHGVSDPSLVDKGPISPEMRAGSASVHWPDGVASNQEDEEGEDHTESSGLVYTLPADGQHCGRTDTHDEEQCRSPMRRANNFTSPGESGWTEDDSHSDMESWDEDQAGAEGAHAKAPDVGMDAQSAVEVQQRTRRYVVPIRFLGRHAELGSVELETPRVVATTAQSLTAHSLPGGGATSSYAAGPSADSVARGANAVDSIMTSRAHAAALLTADGAFGEIDIDDVEDETDGAATGTKQSQDCGLLLYETVKLMTDVLCLGVCVALAVLVLSPDAARPMLEDAMRGLIPVATDVIWGETDKSHMSSAGVFLYLRQIQDRMLLPVVCGCLPALLIMIERLRGWLDRRCEHVVTGESVRRGSSDGAE